MNFRLQKNSLVMAFALMLLVTCIGLRCMEEKAIPQSNTVLNSFQNTGLCAAVKHNNSLAVKLAIKLAANPNTTDNGTPPYTVLQHAVFNKNSDIINILIEAGANVNLAQPQTEPPLLTAIRTNFIEAARLLIEKGADVNAKGWYGIQPIHLASSISSVELVKLLIEKQADLQRITGGSGEISQVEESKDDEGCWWTPLHYAAARGQSHEIIKILLEHRVDPTKLDIRKRTALEIARDTSSLD